MEQRTLTEKGKAPAGYKIQRNRTATRSVCADQYN